MVIDNLDFGGALNYVRLPGMRAVPRQLLLLWREIFTLVVLAV